MVRTALDLTSLVKNVRRLWQVQKTVPWDADETVLRLCPGDRFAGLITSGLPVTRAQSPKRSLYNR
jgi:hypothetical protein